MVYDNQTTNAATCDASQPTTTGGGSVHESLTDIRNRFDGVDRPGVLSHQVDRVVAETLKQELRTEKLYEHVVDDEIRHCAWRFPVTASDSLVKITVEDEDRTHYAIPPFGESVRDLRWWAMNCHVNGREFSIEHVSNGTLNDIMSFTPEEWEPGVSSLIMDAL